MYFQEFPKLLRSVHKTHLTARTRPHRKLPSPPPYKNLKYETSWFDWPQELTSSFDLETIPQEHKWKGWDAIDEAETVTEDDRLAPFVQDHYEPPAPPPEPMEAPPGDLDAAAAPGASLSPEDDDESESSFFA